MKAIFYTLVFILLYSCATNKNDSNNVTDTNLNNEKIKINKYSKEEIKVFNDFLKERIKNDKYKPYQNHSIVIIKEAESRVGSIYAYKNCYKPDFKSKKSFYQGCEYNKSQIENIKSNIEKEYLWKETDFESKKTSLLKTEDLKKSIQLGNYTELPERLLIYASVPLIFEKDKAFFYFKSGNSFFGFSVIEIVTVFMKKNKSGLWEIDTLYFDPNTTW